jgi:alcohol dehydrogenase
MHALVLGPDGPTVRDIPQPSGHGEARIRLLLGGICATDLELCKGYMDFQGVLGHEFVGVVEAAPAPEWVGRRVVGEINCSCGTCATCRAARQTHCPNRTVLGIQGRNGAFSEQFLLPVRNLHLVPDGVPDEAAVFVEPLAAAHRILEQVHVRPSDVVVVLGAGRLGQLCARVLALTGARVHAVDRDPDRLELLPPEVVRGRPEERADIAVDCTGSADGVSLAASLTRPRGTVVLKTTVHEVAPVPMAPWVIDEITVVGSRCGPFEPALRLLASGAVDPRPLISARRPLVEGVEALEMAADPAHVKVLLTPGD